MTPHPPSLPIGADTWWSRPSGGREVLRVAAPLVVSSLSWTIMSFFDRMFLNWVSGAAMDASFTSSVAWFAILALPLGICSYANTFVAQYDGAGTIRPHRPRHVAGHLDRVRGLGTLSLVLDPAGPVPVLLLPALARNRAHMSFSTFKSSACAAPAS